MKKVNDKIAWVLERFVIFFVACSVIDVFAQVLFRYCFHSPIDWTEQLARYFFMLMCMFGLPVAYRNHGLIAFDLLLVKLPVKVQKIIELVGSVLIAAYSFFYLFQSAKLCIKVGNKIAATVIHIPVKYIDAIQLVGAFFLFWFSLEVIWESVVNLKNAGKEA